jgi:fibronectin type 3 domain-containing protein
VLLWNQPTTNTDGSLLTDLQGYNIYQGTAANNLKKVAEVAVNQMNYTATDLSQGTYYFAVSAHNRGGVESALSNVGSKTFAD